MTERRPRTKLEMTEAIAARCAVPGADVTRVLEAFADVVVDDLAEGGTGSASIVGLVKVDVVPRAARAERQGHNPANGEPLTIAARPARERGRLRLRARKRLRDVL